MFDVINGVFLLHYQALVLPVLHTFKEGYLVKEEYLI
jgi:hypothetical protein